MKKVLNKKIFALMILSIIFLSIISSFVFAQAEITAEEAGEGARAISQTIVEIVRGIFEPIVGEPLFGSKQYLFKVFFAILLFLLIQAAITDFFDLHKGISWIISIIVVIISMVAIPGVWIEAIALEYGVMGAAFLSAIPFGILVYYSLRPKTSFFMAVLLWIFFTIYHFGIFFWKIWTISEEYGLWSPEVWPFWVAGLAGIVALIFLGILRKWFADIYLKTQEERADMAVEESLQGISAAGKFFRGLTGKS